jgi:hypothetical protein
LQARGYQFGIFIIAPKGGVIKIMKHLKRGQVMEFSILKRRLDIGKQIDDFLDQVSEAGLLFKHGVSDYLKGNQPPPYVAAFSSYWEPS